MALTSWRTCSENPGRRYSAVTTSFPSFDYHTQPYIFCLSESENPLYQWEMYSGRNGCCITFSNEINKLKNGDRVALAPVIYEKKEQQEYLELLKRIDGSNPNTWSKTELAIIYTSYRVLSS